MAPDLILPAFPGSWKATRATLHAYSRAVAVVPRVHAAPHPRWWHASLEVRPTGLVADPVPVPGGGAVQIRMDLLDHAVFLERSDGATHRLAMTGGMSGSAFGDRLLGALAAWGVEGDYERSRFDDGDAGRYDPVAAETFFGVLVDVDATFRRIRSRLGDSVGPVQFWTHGFDLSFEWFGTRLIEHDEAGQTTSSPAQINLGFFPGVAPYFYCNPWPFDDALISAPLPHGAVWHTDGWSGSLLDYRLLSDDPDAGTVLEEYAAAVHAAAGPGLLA